MVNLTEKWALPLFNDTDMFDPIQTPLGLISTAAEVAMIRLYGMTLPVVPGQAERDLLYPAGVAKPGDGVFRSDLGYEERYFSLYHSTTNPGGRAVAGWQSAAPSIRARVYRAPGINIPQNTVTAVPWTNESYDSYKTHPAGSTRLIAPMAGTYAVDYQIDVSTTSLTTSAWVFVNGSGNRHANSEAVAKNHTGSAHIPLSKGDYVELYVFSSGLVAVGTSAVQTSFSLTWTGAY